MRKIIRWDDSSDKIMDIIELVENNNRTDIPIKCPVCNANNAHIYMHRWENNRGTVWAWCSACKSCAHASRLKLPDWWENAEFIKREIEMSVKMEFIFLYKNILIKN